ncbi:hypothetical protein TW86_04165 [Halomonas sp. S2151]|uniref:hypothetical protein n=1 Tax=Halomonas sp. S2151 TaxID=579478 RepID=UPI0005FA33A0|nr:hypothetical protein [Halomonas sp. S2151]KJZ17453.1 hypothetical protein TW86_04165 [Halomonas sp. S2151]
MHSKVGDRVGALLSVNDGVAKLIGYGEFIGAKVPVQNAIGFGSALHIHGYPNPCIKLDSGKEVFGCECWWGPEDAVKAKLEGLEVIEVDIDEVRKEKGE